MLLGQIGQILIIRNAKFEISIFYWLGYFTETIYPIIFQYQSDFEIWFTLEKTLLYQKVIICNK